MKDKNQVSHLLHSRLKKCRAASALSQRQVADALKIERSTYTYYETGRSQPSLDTLSKLAEIFGVSMFYLIGSENDSTIKVLAPKKEDESTLFTENEDENGNTDEPVPVNTLSKDEQDLILRFRLLPKKQKEEILYSFGLITDSQSSKKDN